MSNDISLINGGYGPVRGGGLVETVDDDFDGYDDDDTVNTSAIILHPTQGATTSTVATSTHSSWNYTIEPQLFRGLSNQGATCYMNSLLQSLYMTPEFRHQLYQSVTTRDHDDATDLETNIPFQLQKLFAHLQLNKERKAIDTKALTKSFGWNSSDVFQQHDVQELCRVLFDALEESLKGTPTEHLVNDLYQGQLKDYVQCASCGNESSRLDNFLDLSLVIRPFGSTQMMQSVEEAIEYFLKPEVLSGENQWDCSKCAKKQDAIKGLKFSKLPYLLALQLKRFDFDYTTFNRIKLNNEVRFPKYLNMNTYVHDTKGGVIARKMSLERQELNDRREDDSGSDRLTADATSPTSVGGSLPSSPTNAPFDENDDDEPLQDTWNPDYDVDAVIQSTGPFVYELFSVLIHSGSAMGGHYYAYIKSFEDGNWFNFNDSTVSRITEAEVRTAWGPKAQPAGTMSYGGYRLSGSTSAYMLMYRLVDRSRNRAGIADSQVPSFLKDLILDDEAKRVEREKEREEKARLIMLKVFCDDATFKTMHISKLTPLQEVTEKACVLFDHITYHPDLVRLRSYSDYTKMPQDTYTGREQCSLMQLQLYTHSCLYLEVRQSVDEPWVEYDGTALQLVVRKYEPHPTPHFSTPPYNLQISDRATVSDLVDVLSTKYGLSRSQCRVLHMSSNGYWNIQTSILNPADEPMYMQRTLQHDIRLRHGSEVYVEACPSLDTWSDAKDLFETKAHEITIQVKCKEKAISSRVKRASVDGGQPAVPIADTVTWPFVVDRRDNLRVLKDRLALFLDMPIDTFKLFRGSEQAQELKDLDTSFKNLTLMDNSTLLVAGGRPLKANEFHVQIKWYQPKQTPTTTESAPASPTSADQTPSPRLFLDGGTTAGELTWLTTLIVSMDTAVDDLRASVRAAFDGKGIAAPYIRLRDFANNRMSMVLADGFPLKNASNLTLYENRQFVVEILPAPEHLPRHHMLYYVTVFDRATFTFGSRHEVVFATRHDTEHWMDVLVAKVAQVTGLPEATMQFAKPFQFQEVSVMDVEEFTWSDRDSGRRYTNLHALGTYGDRLLVSDSAVPLKELSTEERAALLAQVDKSSGIDTLYHNSSTVYGPVAPSGQYGTSTYRYAKPKEAALVIRTKSTKSSSTAASGSDSVPVSPGVSTDDDADSKEYERAGGVALFDDLH
ncbi:hypothetical protein H310_07533 [Aphanomyces invadans]|uniref:USP domain-containing protein n=1 Tax=Aphanomyces invadans TaxID=157072 RepID=A0A024U1I6_9STRA|nr:hypothetical protein H310_07533 [Aphanomyces invadans]ETW00119.1 hypothetical protein H310_07533 [Aphanomyces invadans]|eukprot:XP_008871144.1 hypothetical protein H310_07533 [Aphanomyces invadans]